MEKEILYQVKNILNFKIDDEEKVIPVSIKKAKFNPSSSVFGATFNSGNNLPNIKSYETSQFGGENRNDFKNPQRIEYYTGGIGSGGKTELKKTYYYKNKSKIFPKGDGDAKFLFVQKEGELKKNKIFVIMNLI